jgi:hypothetical protein
MLLIQRFTVRSVKFVRWLRSRPTRRLPGALRCLDCRRCMPFCEETFLHRWISPGIFYKLCLLESSAGEPGYWQVALNNVYPDAIAIFCSSSNNFPKSTGFCKTANAPSLIARLTGRSDPCSFRKLFYTVESK